LRIIAGARRGKIIEAPKGLDTRPTLDRVKESLFGMLQFDIPGAKVLDLFAGSGGLGLECLSRGADLAVFCDASKESAAIIRRNIEATNFQSKSILYPMDYTTAIREAKRRGFCFDIVFLDPPYASALYDPAIEALIEADLLSERAILSVEHAPEHPPRPVPGFPEADLRKYGKVALSIFRRDRL